MAFRELNRLCGRASDLFRESPFYMVQRGIDKGWVYSYTPFAKLNRRNASFVCSEQRYPYFIHTYNATWRNERAVEIALANDFLKDMQGQRVLELGNVMAYYDAARRSSSFYKTYDVVDKYEKMPGVLNTDFLDFKRSEPYDAFLSISTIEHIGWDEPKKDFDKAARALSHIASLVRDKDKVLVSFPLAYNPHLDKVVKDLKHGFKNASCMLRVNRRNDWQECSVDEALKRTYGERFRAANALFIGRGLI